MKRDWKSRGRFNLACAFAPAGSRGWQHCLCDPSAEFRGRRLLRRVLSNPRICEKLMVVIADVAGKSVPAALLMATLQASLRTIAPENAPLADLVRG